MEEGAHFYSISASNVEGLDNMIERKAKQSEMDIMSKSGKQSPNSMSAKLKQIDEERDDDSQVDKEEQVEEREKKKAKMIKQHKDAQAKKIKLKMEK
jgi:hypothetical protein